MTLLFVLALVLVGIVIGGAGMRRAGRWTRRITGPWRPGVGGLAMVALIGAVFLAARGAEIAAVALVLVCLVLALIARRRQPHRPQKTSMSRSDAAALLGVGVDASPAEVETAYKRLMLRTHPDLGGTTGLATQINAARAAMQGR
jgi:hypothetical protein